MSAPTLTVGVALGVAEAGDFIVGDITAGVIGSTEYLVSTGYTTVTPSAYSVSIRRGRWSRLWDAFEAGSVSINLWNHDRTFDPSSLVSPYSGYMVPGRAVKVTANSTVIATAFVDDWDLEYDVSGQSSATLLATDALGVLGQVQFDAWTSSGTSAELKLADICNRSEVDWSGSLRLFDAGVETLQSDAVTWGSSVANYLQLVGRSDLGWVFADAGGSLVFRNRQYAVGTSAAVEFSDDGAVDSVPFTGISATIGSELLFSHVGVDREGGTNQTATVADLAAWRDRYGNYRSLSVSGLLLADDAASLAMAEFLLSLYDSPRYRVSEITVDLTALTTTQQNAVLALDIASVVGVTFTPNSTGDPIVSRVVIQGVAHDIGVDQHRVTFSLIDAPVPFFRVGDAVMGVVGSTSYLIGF